MLKQSLNLQLKEARNLIIFARRNNILGKRNNPMPAKIPEFPLRFWNQRLLFNPSEVLVHDLTNEFNISQVKYDYSCTNLVLNLCKRVLVPWSIVIVSFRCFVDEPVWIFCTSNYPVHVLHILQMLHNIRHQIARHFVKN